MTKENTRKTRVIAFYLPQYHPIPENDLWWGAGFTEWRNVAKAKRLFKGHNQPIIPGELGFYDLRIPEVRERQAQLAKEHNIYGFAYWHYWFGNGKRLLELPLKEVIDSGKPEFPFCLAWANHTWSNKTWTATKVYSKESTLLKQEYLGKKDYELHFYSMLNAFKDPRYIKIEGKLLFVIFNPLEIPDINVFRDTWNELSNKEGLNGFHFLGFTNEMPSTTLPKDLSLDGFINSTNLVYLKEKIKKNKLLRYFNYAINRPPFVSTYKDALKYLIEDNNLKNKELWYPSIIPNWDNSPRAGVQGIILKDPDPELFRFMVADAIKKVQKFNNKLIFLKSWNEWGEGNYIEPDIIHGRDFLKILKQEMDKCE